jgi:hypothetical protein
MMNARAPAVNRSGPLLCCISDLPRKCMSMPSGDRTTPGVGYRGPSVPSTWAIPLAMNELLRHRQCAVLHDTDAAQRAGDDRRTTRVSSPQLPSSVRRRKRMRRGTEPSVPTRTPRAQPTRCTALVVPGIRLHGAECAGPRFHGPFSCTARRTGRLLNRNEGKVHASSIRAARPRRPCRDTRSSCRTSVTGRTTGSLRRRGTH